MSTLINQVLDFFLPRFCGGCGKKFTATENYVCNDCLSNIVRPTKEKINDDYSRNFSSGFVEEIFPIFLFVKDGAIQNIIHAIKYNQNISLAKFIGQQIGQILATEKSDLHFDCIIPVPLHSLKKSERGFNQSEHLSKGIAKILRVKLNKKIVRTRFTDSQTKLNRQEREKNIQSAFKTKYNFTGKNILLVDDVMTTGATINECAKVLKNAGAANVYACSIALAD